MNKWLVALAALLASAIPALAQTPPGTITSSGIAGAYNSGTKTCTDGFFCYIQTDVNGQLKVTGSFSSSTTGFPTIQSTGTPISVTTGGVTGTLPTGAVVVASNVGTTNIAYCKLGASATTSDIPLAPNGGWFAFTVGANTQLTCITSASTTTVNMAGGSGLPTGTGGGGGGSGGSVTQGTSPWIVAGGGTAGSAASGVVTVQGIASMTPLLSSIPTWAGGTLGAMANYGTSPGAVLVPGVNAFVTNTNANGAATSANSSPVVLASDSVDVCFRNAKTNFPVSFQTTTLTQQIAASGSNKIYICSLSLVASAATVFSLSGGTGSNCASAQLGILGVAGTATHGLSLAANGGLTLGNGTGTVAVTAASSALCLVQSGAGDISGNITYVQAP